MITLIKNNLQLLNINNESLRRIYFGLIILSYIFIIFNFNFTKAFLLMPINLILFTLLSNLEDEEVDENY